MSRTFFALPMVLAATTVACSPDTADLFLAGGTSAGGAGGASGSTSSVSKAVTSTSTSPPDTTATTVTVTTGNPDTVASTTTGPPPDTVSASSGNPGGPKVDCGSAGSCSTENDGVCCFDEGSNQSGCTSAGECTLTGTGGLVTAISCQLPSDCPGKICCGTRYFDSGEQVYETTECVSTCNAPDVQLCEQGAPNICPFYFEMGQQKQMVCKASTILPAGYFVCGRPNPP